MKRIHCNCTSFDIGDEGTVDTPEYWFKEGENYHWFCKQCESIVNMISIGDDDAIDYDTRGDSTGTVKRQLDQLNEPYTTSQVAGILGYKNGNSIRKLIERDRLRSIKRGNVNLLYKEDVLRFVAVYGIRCQNTRNSHQQNGKRQNKSTSRQ